MIAILASLAFMMIACQEDKDIVNTSEDEIIEPETFLFENIQRIVLLDGSLDNIIDNGSCISVLYPIDVIANGEEVSLRSVDDLTIVQSIHDRERFDVDNMEIKFPIQVLTSDYSLLEVTSKDQLETLSTACVEGGEDEDIECLDFVYPIDLKIYDGLNQKLERVSLTSDADFFRKLEDSPENGWIAINYPISIATPSDLVQVNSNTDLRTVIQTDFNQCDESDVKYYGDPTNPITLGNVIVSVTDAPFPIDLIAEANVTINRVDIMGSIEDSTYFFTLSEEEFSFNLIELTNGIKEEIVDMNIPSGEYEEIRLFISQSNILLKDSSLFDLQVPSGSSSGLKIKIEPGISITEEQSTEILLDFDLSRSFVVQGNPNTPAGINGFIFKPVVKGVNTNSTGDISGTVTSINDELLRDVLISVFADDTLNTTTYSDESGQYMILGLLPGTYDVTAELENYNSITFTEQVITANDELILDITLEEM